MVLGPFGFGVIEAARDTASFTVLAQLALTVILFNQAAELDLRRWCAAARSPFRLLVIGIPLAIVLGTVDRAAGAAGDAVVGGGVPGRDRRADRGGADRRTARGQSHPRARPACACPAESGFYDGFALAAMLAALALASEQTDPDPSRWGWFAGPHRGGVAGGRASAIGAVGGLVIARSRQRGWMSDTWAQLATARGGAGVLRSRRAVARQRIRRRLRRRPGLRDDAAHGRARRCRRR